MTDRRTATSSQPANEASGVLDDLGDGTATEKAEALGSRNARKIDQWPSAAPATRRCDGCRQPTWWTRHPVVQAGSTMMRRSGSSPTDRVVTPVYLVEDIVHDLAIGRRHRLQRPCRPRGATCSATSRANEPSAASRRSRYPATSTRKSGLVVAETTLCGDSSEILHGVECPATRADEQAEFASGHRRPRVRFRRPSPQRRRQRRTPWSDLP